MRSGPLAGVRLVELAGLGPAPFCGMLLSDLGADIVRIVRPERHLAREARFAVTTRGRRSLALDLKKPDDVETALRLIDKAEGVFEGFRPGVMERLGLGPDVALARNSALVYGRMTGWGQTGPLAPRAGHDANYIAITGALNAIGPRERPVMPLNLVGDYGGGAMFLAVGMVAAILHARQTKVGQVVDAAMSDCSALLMASLYGLFAAGEWSADRSSNIIDGAAPHYNVFRCADGHWITLCSLEKPFYRIMIDKLDLDPADFPYPPSPDRWPAMRAVVEERILQKTRDQWIDIFGDSDACFAPILDFAEAPNHPHNVARGTFVTVDSVLQPAPAPRFSETPAAISTAPTHALHGDEIFAEWDVTPA